MKNPVTFPVFKNIEIDDKDVISSFVSNYPIYSDFNFVSLFTWNVNRTASYSFLNGNLVIRLSDYNNKKEVVYSILGSSLIDETIDTLFETLKITQMSLVPEITRKLLTEETKKYEIHEDRDDFDYIYSVDQLLRMEGSEHQKLRGHIRRYRSQNEPLPEFEIFKETDSTSISSLLDLAKAWRVMKGRHYFESSFEYFAIRRALNHKDALPIEIYCLKQEDKIIAFTVLEIQGENAIAHFEKTRPDISGLGSYLKHEILRVLYDRGCKALNYEQDLGLEGLRRYKLSLGPKEYLKKYSILKTN